MELFPIRQPQAINAATHLPSADQGNYVPLRQQQYLLPQQKAKSQQLTRNWAASVTSLSVRALFVRRSVSRAS